MSLIPKLIELETTETVGWYSYNAAQTSSSKTTFW